jgi:hypothetical protein
MNPTRRTVSPTVLPTALALLLTVAPFASAAARAQTLPREQQEKSCRAQALELLKECEVEEQEEKAEASGASRSGLGWTGIGLLSAGGALLVSAATVNRWRACGPPYDSRECDRIERRQGISGGTLLATGLTFLVIDETRRGRERGRARQTAIAIGPRAIQVRMLF